MHRRFNFDVALSCLLSTGLVFGPCHCTSIECSNNQFVSLEELGLESLGLDKEYKKLLQPIRDLNVSSGRKNMIANACQFLTNLNRMTGSKLSIDDGIYHTASTFHNNGFPQKESKISSFRNMLKNPKALCVDGDEEFSIECKKGSKKEFGNIDDMTDTEVLAYVSVFCGCLMMMIPNGICQGLGGSLVVGGIQQIAAVGYRNENERRNR